MGSSDVINDGAGSGQASRPPSAAVQPARPERGAFRTEVGLRWRVASPIFAPAGDTARDVTSERLEAQTMDGAIGSTGPAAMTGDDRPRLPDDGRGAQTGDGQ